ncbi:LLM class F420-dependent oxidoreductase [Streptomyces harbinensis]|uniref:Probable F420-dependent oxidoreductase, MSMEG_4141 family n=1 Tax=Streptomyces harbinensis TaxID=1176198 RepID=A0A1I6T525_9ACTN|nr:LLM class F420-dependent oxidoreductase [Streptomyces harbinensis]SFS84345.1 probable F420-dependent oxidoreductase, MSMEG_4141 family [Streptomyces harbinensis]
MPMTQLKDTIGRIGIWTPVLRAEDPERRAQVTEAATELDRLGYGAIWLGGSPRVRETVPLLEATSRIVVATGILSIWNDEPADVAQAYRRVSAAFDDRLLLGLGVSHQILTERYEKPYSAMRAFLAALDEATPPVPKDRRVLAALGPRMLELARTESAGAHPYLVTAAHTARAREALGDQALLAPDLKVVLDEDDTRARETARAYLARYLALPNYTNNLKRLGFTDPDFENGGSDALLDEVFALGTPDAVRTKVATFHEAGADHVALNVVTRDDTEIPLPQWHTLAEALL